jgi:triacylglycerol lipase
MSTATIVLAHGIFRFDKLSQLLRVGAGIDIGIRYFDGIPDHLRAHGFVVHEPDVDFAGSLATRASDLRDRLERILQTSGGPLHIIGHSMGGLDARKVIADHPELGAHVSCLTTIGTPHHGTTSADRVLSHGADPAIDALSPFVDLEGFRDLTTTACRAFNDRVLDTEVRNNVRYRTVAASETFGRTTMLLQPFWIQLASEGNKSDGIVPTTSQAWTPELLAGDGTTKRVEQLSFPMPADHLNEVGLWDIGELAGFVSKSEFERRVKDFYLQLAQGA